MLQIDPRPEGLTLTAQLETLGHLERRHYVTREAPDIAANVRDGIEQQRGRVMTQTTKDIISLSKSGCKNSVIMGKLNVSHNTVERAVKKGRKLGLLMTHIQKRELSVKNVIRLYNARTSVVDIAASLELSEKHIYNVIRAYRRKHELAAIRRAVNVSDKTKQYVGMYKGGKRIVDIAREIGEKVSIVDAAIRRARKRGDLPDAAKERKELNEKMLEMYKQGMKAKEIANKLGVYYTRTKGVIQRYKKQEEG